MITRFKELYKNEIISSLKKEFEYKNVHEIPKILKVVINMGVSDAVSDSKVVNSAVSDLTAISGQKPIVTFAKKSIAAFKLREGMKIGAMVV